MITASVLIPAIRSGYITGCTLSSAKREADEIEKAKSTITVNAVLPSHLVSTIGLIILKRPVFFLLLPKQYSSGPAFMQFNAPRRPYCNYRWNRGSNLCIPGISRSARMFLWLYGLRLARNGFLLFRNTFPGSALDGWLTGQFHDSTVHERWLCAPRNWLSRHTSKSSPSAVSNWRNFTSDWVRYVFAIRDC